MLFAGLLRRRAADALDIDELYRRHAGLVIRRVRRFFPDDTEEVVHEVFLHVIEKAHTYRAEASPTTWLYQVTTRLCLNRLRSRRRRQAALSLYAQDPWSATPPANPEAQLFLDQFWSTLSPELATIGVYYFVDDLSHQQIAEITGHSRRTIGNRIEDLRTQMKAAAQGG